MILDERRKQQCFTVKSRMNREDHVRFCGRFGGEIPPYLPDVSRRRNRPAWALRVQVMKSHDGQGLHRNQIRVGLRVRPSNFFARVSRHNNQDVLNKKSNY